MQNTDIEYLSVSLRTPIYKWPTSSRSAQDIGSPSCSTQSTMKFAPLAILWLWEFIVGIIATVKGDNKIWTSPAFTGAVSPPPGYTEERHVTIVEALPVSALI